MSGLGQNSEVHLKAFPRPDIDELRSIGDSGLVGDLSRVGPERLVPETLPFAAPRSFGPGGAIGISTSLSISAMAKASPMLAAKSIGSLGLGP